jgi:hypothetical protein
MNEPAPMNNPSFPTGTNPVFSPAVRFAPKELSLSQAIRRIAYWVTIIAVVLVMGRSGFPMFARSGPNGPATALSSKTKPYEY